MVILIDMTRTFDMAGRHHKRSQKRVVRCMCNRHDSHSHSGHVRCQGLQDHIFDVPSVEAHAHDFELVLAALGSTYKPEEPLPITPHRVACHVSTSTPYYVSTLRVYAQTPSVCSIDAVVSSMVHLVHMVHVVARVVLATLHFVTTVVRVNVRHCISSCHALSYDTLSYHRRLNTTRGQRCVSKVESSIQSFLSM